MSDNNWSSRKNNRRHPRGLRGKDIGLYYRDLYKSGKVKPKKENQINFRIPPAVLNRVQCNLDYISLIAASENVQISHIGKKHINRNLFSSPDVPVKTENELSSSQINIKQESSESSEARVTLIKQEKMEEDVASSEYLEKSEFPRKIKQEDIKPGTSQDFISLSYNTDNQTETELLAFRNTRNYKYGYQDIITGTFEEKLDEELSKGLSINKKTEEVESLNQKIQEELKNMVTKSEYKKMMKFRECLPAYKKTREILDVVHNNQIVVISGETGCGKSTQVPQIILDDAIVNGNGACVNILVTQPRRIAASSLAMRVASERAEKLGKSVGYAVRLDKVDARERGSITFCTTGILLAELEVNQSLSKYSHIILDEVHERDSHIDLSMCMLKRVLKKRKDLTLILMSATLDAETLSTYFDKCPLMHIEGLAYPVNDVYLEEVLQMINYKPKFKKPDSGRGRFHHRQRNVRAQEEEREIQYRAEIHPWLNKIRMNLDPDVYNALLDPTIEDLNINIIVDLLQNICKKEPGAILVFLPGIGEISKLIRLMNESKMFPSNYYEIYPLHSKLATIDQHKIFERPREGVRKIVIATNIAETSITIDDVVYVVDCGKMKYNGLNITQNISTLKVEWIAQANMRQRRGRAGRCQPGTCYHLVTSFRASKLEERILPELQRSNLLESVLALKQLRLGYAAHAFKTVPSPPADVTVERAVKHLQQIGALDANETLTPLGWHLARLPVHPSAGKLLVFGALFGLLDRAASVAAVWGFKDPFNLVIGKEMECSEMKRQLTLGETSDHVAISEAIIRWERLSTYQEKRQFAYKYFLSDSTLQLLSDMKKQLADSLRQMGFLASGSITEPWSNRNSNNFSLFKAIIAASLYPNIGNARWINLYGNNIKKDCRVTTYTPENGRVFIHPSSVLCGPKGPNDTIKYGFTSNRQLFKSPGANWHVYWMKQKSSDLFIFEITLVYTLPLLFFGELDIVDAEDNHDECFITIATCKVRCNKDTARILLEMRAYLNQVLESRITESSDGSTRNSKFEKHVLDAVIELITAEDEKVEYINGEDDDVISVSDDSDHEGSRRTWNQKHARFRK